MASSLLYNHQDPKYFYLQNDKHYSQRHFDFIKQSLENLQKALLPFHTQILIVEEEAINVFEKLNNLVNIHGVFSHQETGLQITYDRDLQVAQYFKVHNIKWTESINNGVIRGIQNRKTW